MPSNHHTSLELTASTPVATAMPQLLALAKQQARVDHSYDDALIASYLETAVSLCESYLARSIRPQTYTFSVMRHQGHMSLGVGSLWGVGLWDADWLAWHSGHKAVELPYSPVTAITAVNMVDWEGNVTALTALAQYWQDLQTQPARVRLKQHDCWVPCLDRTDIVYTTGYGAAGGPVMPPAIQQAILFITAGFYRNRGDEAVEAGLTPTAQRLLAPYRIKFWS